MQVARHTRPEGHFKVWATMIFFQRPLPPFPIGLKQGYPFYSPYGCRLGYHQSEAWPVEQKALPLKLYVASVTTGTQTHTLLIKHQSLNPVLYCSAITRHIWHDTMSTSLCLLKMLLLRRLMQFFNVTSKSLSATTTFLAQRNMTICFVLV